MRKTLLLSALLTCTGPSVLRAQFNATASENAFINGGLGVTTQYTDLLNQGGESMGKNARYVTLAIKSQKLRKTREQNEAKQKERSLHRQQLRRLADGLTKATDIFNRYYDKFKLVGSAVNSFSTFYKITKRIKTILESLYRMRNEMDHLPSFSTEELNFIEGQMNRLIKRTSVVTLTAKAVLTGEDSNREELDEIREEHGEFFVLMSQLDRTDRLRALDDEIGRIINDTHSLINFLISVKNARENENTDKEPLDRLFARQ